ncbi:glycosyltransferase family 2 protein [Pseudoroseicyclus tamaricis]|uniref:Glycosyltransferase n=1 Tax=Pseudoroseicyclus tamaricis TaxID=2705421 RepID=A0A6B2JN72_9RHOB|nr:glycosyltransferase [Pseudoroseicyclus tamaricis]NDU99467.1 glycosyltransferase [Pseudoroseicyclus tamaricis]
MDGISIIIPANNEAGRIGPCLAALAASAPVAGAVEIIVSANACRDATVAEAEAARPAIEARGWRLALIDRAEPGKPGALNAGDAAARLPARLYLDADVTVSPPLLARITALLSRPEPAYASGRLQMEAGGPVPRAYARTWARVPFMARGVPGAGLFAVNAAGRARWGTWPEIIADDIFARLQFAPAERHLADAPYRWPLAPDWRSLVRVRRRQDAGVREIAARYPELAANEDKLPLGLAAALRLAARDPLSMGVYSAVALATRTRPSTGWTRSR